MELGIIASILTFAALLAVIEERLIEALIAPWLPEAVKSIIRVAIAPRVSFTIDADKIGSWALLATGVSGGLLVSFGFGVDLVSPLASAAGAGVNPTLGMLLTGLAIGGGSNLVHDVFGAARRHQNWSGVDLSDLEPPANWPGP